jgi:hypothetical protein
VIRLAMSPIPLLQQPAAAIWSIYQQSRNKR